MPVGFRRRFSFRLGLALTLAVAQPSLGAPKAEAASARASVAAKKADAKTKAEPKKAEAKKAEPKKAEAKGPEPKKAEPKKAEAKGPEPKKAEPRKAEAKGPEAKKPGSKSEAKQEPRKPEAKRSEPKLEAKKFEANPERSKTPKPREREAERPRTDKPPTVARVRTSAPEKPKANKPRAEPKTQPAAAKSRLLPKHHDQAQTKERTLAPPGRARPMLRSASPRLVTPPREVAERSLAFHYANLSDMDAIAELNRRGISWVPASPPLPGVRTPIRLKGPLQGVTIRSTLKEAERATSAFEILDARLALALDDFCRLLARHDVVELVHYTMYRPPAVLPPDLTKQIRHPAGLAIDLGAVKKRDGRWLAIGPHWPSDIGAKTCGEGAREHWSRPAREIVSIACEAAERRMFHFILTPHFDAAHADHLHLEIKPDTRWFMVN